MKLFEHQKSGIAFLKKLTNEMGYDKMGLCQESMKKEYASDAVPNFRGTMEM